MAQANLILSNVAKKHKISLTLTKRSMVTAGLLTLSAAGVAAYGYLLLNECITMRQGRAVVQGNNRMLVTYEHLPGKTFDVAFPSSLPSGSVVIVWAYGSEPWFIRGEGTDPPSGNGDPPAIMAKLLFVWAFLLIFWYFRGVK